MKNIFRRIGYGMIVWVIPYAASIPLLGLRMSDPLVFKSIVTLIGIVSASVLAVVYFTGVKENYLRESVLLSVTWVIVNWILDAAGILPFSHQTLSRYFIEIGIEYPAMMAPIIAIGYLLSQKIEGYRLR